MRLIAKILTFIVVLLALSYAGLTLFFQWQTGVEDRALVAQFLSQPDGMQAVAAGWDNRTLVIIFPYADQASCDVWIDELKAGKQANQELHAVGFRHVTCMEAEADIQ